MNDLGWNNTPQKTCQTVGKIHDRKNYIEKYTEFGMDDVKIFAISHKT